jgi:hypothetical protein
MDDDFAADGGVPPSRGYGRGRSSSGLYERQTSDRGGWFDQQGVERNSSRGGLVDDELGGGGSASPRKGYTRAPFDDWRGMKAGGGEGSEYKGGEEGWRTSGPSSRAPKWGSSGGGSGAPGSGAPNTWRSTERYVSFLFLFLGMHRDTVFVGYLAGRKSG